MSVHGLEVVLWRLCYDATAAEQYVADKERFLQRFRLQPDEAALVTSADVRGLLSRGINDMLVYTFFQSLYGRSGTPRYLALVNGSE